MFPPIDGNAKEEHSCEGRAEDEHARLSKGVAMTRRTLATISLAVWVAACALPAQETHRTVTNPSPNPQDDTKPNSGAVPEAYALTGHFDRIVVIRLKNGANLLEGMKREVKEQNIQNGVILSAIGSLRGYEVHQISNRELPTQDTFEKNPMQPADLVGMNGYVINGRIHAHMTLATPDHVIAGHVEEGNEVYTYAIVTIGVMNATDLDKIDDKTYR
jgi:predicted DNA-binding protein with PD1-like motif